jgi:hypothetical protein
MKQITQFWKWFQEHEEAVKNAILLGINTEAVILELDTRYKAISKRIGFKIVSPTEEQEKFTFIFSGDGYPKLFAKIRALEAMAPPLEYFTPQAFIQPIVDKTPYLSGEDDPYTFFDCELKISDLYVAITDYNLTTKQLKIIVYTPHYISLEDYDDVWINLKIMVVDVLGELVFRKNIRNFDVAQLPEHRQGLIPLIDLQDPIDYMYVAKSRRKML